MEIRGIEAYKLEISASVEVNGDVYFIAFNAPALFKKDKMGEIKIVFPFGSNIKNLYTGIIVYQNKVLLIPCHAREFIMYDICTSKLLKKEIPNLMKQKHQDNFFDGAVLYGRYAIVVGGWYAGIAKIDMENFDIEIINNWYEEYQKKRVLDHKTFFNTDICAAKDSIFMLMSNASYVVEYDLLKEKVLFHQLSDSNIFWINICYDGYFFWLRGEDNQCIRWNADTEESMEYGYVDDNKKDTEVGYIRSWYQNEAIYFSNRSKSYILKMNLDKHKKNEILRVDRNEFISKDVINKLCFSPLNKGDVIYESLYFGISIEQYIEYIKQLQLSNQQTHVNKDVKSTWKI